MAEKTKPTTLLVMPSKGKYCEIVVDGQIFKIWKVHPNTPDSYGTAIPYDAVIEGLCRIPSSIALVPQVKNGKFVSEILPEDQEKIKAAVARGYTGSYANYNAKASTKLSDVLASGDSSEALTKALEMLETQVKKNNTLEETLASLAGRLAQLEANADSVDAGGDGGNAELVE